MRWRRRVVCSGSDGIYLLCGALTMGWGPFEEATISAHEGDGVIIEESACGGRELSMLLSFVVVSLSDRVSSACLASHAAQNGADLSRLLAMVASMWVLTLSTMLSAMVFETLSEMSASMRKATASAAVLSSGALEESAAVTRILFIFDLE